MKTYTLEYTAWNGKIYSVDIPAPSKGRAINKFEKPKVERTLLSIRRKR